MKAKKKPAKKATAPRIKLKDGKYSHKFLCRLEPGTGKKLEELGTLTRNKTFNGTVKHVIEGYAKQAKDLEAINTQLNIANANNAQYKRIIEGFKGSFKALQEIKPITKVQTGMFDDYPELEED